MLIGFLIASIKFYSTGRRNEKAKKEGNAVRKVQGLQHQSAKGEKLQPRQQGPIQKAKVSNCLLWALAQWWRFGGGLLVEKSAFGWWLHFSWRARSGEIWEFNQVASKRRRICPPWLFLGRAGQRKKPG